MDFCIDLNNDKQSEMILDGSAIKLYLESECGFSSITEKQIKRKIIDLIKDETRISRILDELDINYKYFVEMIYVNYPQIFSTSFINKYIKVTYGKYQNL